MDVGRIRKKHNQVSDRAAKPAGALNAVERLEERLLLSVTRDSDGWTVVAPSSDSRLVYVSDSQGSDGNSGLSANAPVKSLERAEALLRDGMPDQLLLKRGDTWTNQSFEYWAGGGGRSAQEPKVIGSYGSGARPKIVTGGAPGWSARAVDVINHLFILGVDFVGARQSPGIDRVSPGTDMLVENVSLTRFGTGVAVVGWYSTLTDFTLRRSVIADNYSPNGGNSQGMYLDQTRRTLIEENVFYKNGWMASDRSDASMHNHGIYFSAANDDAVVRKNIIADSSSHGLQMRGGGNVQDNLFVNNPIGLSFGLVNGASLKVGGVTGDVGGNVFLQSNDMNFANQRGWAIEVGNTKAGARIHDNVMAHNQSLGDFPAIILQMPMGPNNPDQSPGIRDLVIENNIVYDWKRAIGIESGYKFGGSGIASINGLVVRNNEFQMSQRNGLVNHPQALAPGYETWSGNKYFDTRDQGTWYSVQRNDQSFGQWKNAIEPSAQAVRQPYADPNRTIQSYDGSYSHFAAAMTAQSKDNWNPRYTAAGVIDYIRRGFAAGGSTPGNTPPPPPIPPPPPPTNNPPPPTAPKPPSTPPPTSSSSSAINGTSGNDTILVELVKGQVRVTVNGAARTFNSAKVIEVYGNGGNDTIKAGAGIRNVLFDGGAGNDTLTGGNDNDRLNGGDGNDVLRAGRGNDILDGGAGSDQLFGDDGNDKLVGAAGADVFNGGAGTDTADYSKYKASLTITIDNIANDGIAKEADNVRTDVENVLGGSGADKITGSSSNNVLTGNSGNDQLFGGAGNDLLSGGLGTDQLFGKDGAMDTLDGGAGVDRADGDAIPKSWSDKKINI